MKNTNNVKNINKNIERLYNNIKSDGYGERCQLLDYADSKYIAVESMDFKYLSTIQDESKGSESEGNIYSLQVSEWDGKEYIMSENNVTPDGSLTKLNESELIEAIYNIEML